jgi:3-oxoacyl-[acyl-carrier-protein] synthase-3
MSRILRFENIALAGITHALPEEILSSAQLEERLSPLYSRLRLPSGRLELITGIRERRLWPADMLPGQQSARTVNKLLDHTGFDRKRIGMLLHASVCRDYLEPATACGVHHAAGLDAGCLIYDVSNACLGVMNGVIQIASHIQSGHIDAGIVVGTESSRNLIDATVNSLNNDATLTREAVKASIASLTIGSGSAAILVTRADLAPDAPRFTSAAVGAWTEHHQLCHSGRDEAIGSGMAPLMLTDSEQLMHAGIDVGKKTFQEWMHAMNWTKSDIHRSICHQVGLTHRKLMLESLDLSPDNDYFTVDWLGNTGSVALPMTLSLSLEMNPLHVGQRAVLLGIGSGINVVMMSVER